MSSHPNVTKEEMINLAKLAEQQKTQRTIKTKNKTLEQTQDKKLDESFKLITKKLGEVDKSTKKIKVFETSHSENKTRQIAIKILEMKHFLNQLYKMNHIQVYYMTLHWNVHWRI